MKYWKVTYNHGLNNTTIVQAKTAHDAKFQGLAEYRKNYGCDGVLDNFAVDFIVKSVQLI